MKKFFGKLPVMITFVALAVVMAVFYIGMLVRPVAIGMTYKGKVDMGMGEKMEMTIKVKSGSEVDVKISMDESSMEMENIRYIEHDRQIYVLLDNAGEELSDKEYKELKEEAIENWDDLDEMGALMDANAFVIGDDEDTLKCTGSIIFAVIGGVLVAGLVTFGTLSVLYYVKGKKQA